MAQYIDKNALMAEIERRKKEYEVDIFLDRYFQGWMECTEDGSAVMPNLLSPSINEIKDIAKHFFVLGLKAQKRDDMNYLNTDLLQIIDKEATEMWQEINTGHNYVIIDSYEQFYGICVQIAETIIKNAHKND